MEVLKVIVSNDRDGRLFIADALRVDGSLWIVPRWIENLSERYKEPERTIRVPESLIQPAPPSFPAQLLVTAPLPIVALEGPPVASKADDEFEVRVFPGFRVPIPRRDVS